MVTCDKCNEKIGFMSNKEELVIDTKKVTYCNDCYEKHLEKLKKEEKQRDISALKKNNIWEYSSVAIETNSTYWDALSETSTTNKIKSNSENILADFGAKGWELVSTTPINRVGSTATNSIVFFFKRKI